MLIQLSRGRDGLILFLAGCFCSQLSGAAEVLPGVPQGDGIVRGATTIYPVVGIEWADDDNLFRSPSTPLSSTLTILNGGLGFETVSGPNSFALGYLLTTGRYDDFERADYDDQRFFGSAALEFNPRNHLELKAEVSDQHDGYGSGRTENLTSAPAFDQDEWSGTQVDGLYSIGADGSKGRIELEAGIFDKSYDNNRGAAGCADRNDRTDTSCLDRDSFNYGAAFFYRVASNTSLLAQVRINDTNYAETDLDSTDTDYLVGVTWEATNNTTGTLKVGREERDLDEPDLGDFSGTTWEVDVEWRPRSYSSVTFRSLNTTEEPDGSGDFRERLQTGIGWRHEWGDRLSTYIEGTLGSEDFGSSTRADDTGAGFVSISYKVRRWLYLRAEYRYNTVDSNIERFEFRRNLYSVGLWGTP